MSTILSIETSGKNCSIALFTDHHLVQLIEERTKQFSHSEHVHRAHTRGNSHPA